MGRKKRPMVDDGEDRVPTAKVQTREGGAAVEWILLNFTRRLQGEIRGLVEGEKNRRQMLRSIREKSPCDEIDQRKRSGAIDSDIFSAVYRERTSETVTRLQERNLKGFQPPRNLGEGWSGKRTKKEF